MNDRSKCLIVTVDLSEIGIEDRDTGCRASRKGLQEVFDAGGVHIERGLQIPVLRCLCDFAVMVKLRREAESRMTMSATRSCFGFRSTGCGFMSLVRA